MTVVANLEDELMLHRDFERVEERPRRAKTIPPRVRAIVLASGHNRCPICGSTTWKENPPPRPGPQRPGRADSGLLDAPPPDSRGVRVRRRERGRAHVRARGRLAARPERGPGLARPAAALGVGGMRLWRGRRVAGPIDRRCDRATCRFPKGEMGTSDIREARNLSKSATRVAAGTGGAGLVGGRPFGGRRRHGGDTCHFEKRGGEQLRAPCRRGGMVRGGDGFLWATPGQALREGRRASPRGAPGQAGRARGGRRAAGPFH